MRRQAASPLLQRLRELALQNLSGAWPEARRKDPDGFRSALSQVFQAIHVDLTRKEIVAVTPQPEFRHFFAEGTYVTWTRAPDTWYYPFQPTLSAEEKESATPERNGALGPGDPEGIRTLDLHRDRVAC